MSKLLRIASLGLLASLVGCQEPQPEPSLELACQVKKCSCIGGRTSIVGAPEKTEVQWTDNGAAYCPDGYRLEPDQSQSKDWLRRYGG